MIGMELQINTSRHGDDRCRGDTCPESSNWPISGSHLSMGLNKCLDCLLSQSFPIRIPPHEGVHPVSRLRLEEAQSPAMTTFRNSQPQEQPSFSEGHDFAFPRSCRQSFQKTHFQDTHSRQSATITAIKCGHTPMRMMMLSLLILTLCSNQTLARSVGICRGVPCANGGHLLVDNSVWGHCRCRCPPKFLGPYCQYQIAEKRSSDTGTNVDNRRLGRSEALERIRVRLLELSERMALTQITSELTTLGDQEAPGNNSELPSDEEIGSRIDGPDTSMTSYGSARARRSWYQELTRR